MDADRPLVTVVDPAGRPRADDVLEAGRTGPSRRTKVVVGLVTLGLLADAGSSVLAHLRRAERQQAARAAVAAAAREAAALRLTLVSWSARPQRRLGAAVVEAHVDLMVANAGATPVRLVSGRLDGSPPPAELDPRPLAPAATAVVAARWRVRCAEVGSVPGPRTLLLRVAPVGGHEHEVRVDLRPGNYGNGGLVSGAGRGPSQVFRLSASDACALS